MIPEINNKRHYKLKDALEALHEDKEHYKKIVQAMSDYIYVVHVENGRPVVTEHGEGCISVTGYSSEEHAVEPLLWHRMIYDDDKDAVVKQANAALSGQMCHPLEHRLIHKDGSIRWVKNTVVPRMDKNGRLTAYYGVISDITERKLAEEQIRQCRDHLEEIVKERTLDLMRAKEVAEAASLAKSTFLANISHDLRTPLTGIIGLSELLPELAEEESEMLESINIEANALLGLIDDILDISKIETGKLQLEEIAFNISHLIDSVARTAEVKAKQKGINLKMYKSKDIPALLFGDPIKLRQVLMNLLSNGVKFTNRGSVIFNADITEIDNDVALCFEVSDTGIGIPREKQAAIFDPFIQVDTSTTRVYGGTGLGLAICKRLVELMGGELGVESENGQGSTFYFHIVLKKAEGGMSVYPNAAANAADVDAKQKGLRHAKKYTKEYAREYEKPEPLCISGQIPRVLLVEDYHTNQQVVLRYLIKAGYEVDLAENGKDAVEKFTQHNYNLILMDIQMPIMDGFTATKAIRQIEAEQQRRRIPIIAMTAHAIAGYADKCVKEGMDDYISKPLRKTSLLSMMQKWTESLLPEDRHAKEYIEEHEDAPTTGELIDFDSLLNDFDGDRDIVLKILKDFIETTMKQLPVIEKAINEQGISTLKRHVHSIKGGALNLTAKGMADAAYRLETIDESCNKEELYRLLGNLMKELCNLKRYCEGL
jgi:PAS domain S-box-containing protein